MKRQQRREVSVGVELPGDVWKEILWRVDVKERVETISKMHQLSTRFLSMMEEVILPEITSLESPTIYKMPAKLLRMCINVRKISYVLRNTKGLDSSLFAHMTRLEELETNDFNSTTNSLENYSRNLKSLSFFGHFGTIPNLERFTDLESLVFTNGTDFHSIILQNLPEDLKSLQLLCECAAVPGNIKSLTNLTSLDIVSYSVRNISIGEAITNMTSLQTLSLSMVALNIMPSHVTSFASSLTKLTLDVQGTMTTTIDSLLVVMTSLTDLNLKCRNKIFTGTSLLEMTNLKKLLLEDGEIDKNHLKKLSRVVDLTLVSNHSVDNETLQNLSQLKKLCLIWDRSLTNDCYLGLTRLETLILSDCHYLSNPKTCWYPPSLKTVYYHSMFVRDLTLTDADSDQKTK